MGARPRIRRRAFCIGMAGPVCARGPIAAAPATGKDAGQAWRKPIIRALRRLLAPLFAAVSVALALPAAADGFRNNMTPGQYWAYVGEKTVFDMEVGSSAILFGRGFCWADDGLRVFASNRLSTDEVFAEFGANYRLTRLDGATFEAATVIGQNVRPTHLSSHAQDVVNAGRCEVWEDMGSVDLTYRVIRMDGETDLAAWVATLFTLIE